MERKQTLDSIFTDINFKMKLHGTSDLFVCSKTKEQQKCLRRQGFLAQPVVLIKKGLTANKLAQILALQGWETTHLNKQTKKSDRAHNYDNYSK